MYASSTLIAFGSFAGPAAPFFFEPPKLLNKRLPNVRFIALHIISVKIKPDTPIKQPETTKTVLLIANRYTKGEVSPSLQSLRLFRYPLCGGHPRNAPDRMVKLLHNFFYRTRPSPPKNSGFI